MPVSWKKLAPWASGLETASIQVRQEARRKYEEELELLLASNKKKLEEQRLEKRYRKQAVSQLLSKLDIEELAPFIIRDPEDYTPKTYNYEKQLIGLLKHMFVRYEVPECLYRSCFRLPEVEEAQRHAEDFSFMNELYRWWFILLAQGGSFPKAVRGLMTKAEAHAFLFAPSCTSVSENVWWARLEVAGVTFDYRARLVDRIFKRYFFDDPDSRLLAVVLFFGRFHAQMDRPTFEELIDFIDWTLRHSPEFSFKGRTLGSMIKLCEEWQKLMQTAKAGRFIGWKGLGIAPWRFETDSAQSIIVELRDNRELISEGRKQKHCVYSYVDRCMNGQSFIFSLRVFSLVVDSLIESSRVTIEVDSHRWIVQIRRRFNCRASKEEIFVIRQWADAKGIYLVPDKR